MPQFEAPIVTQVFWLLVSFGLLYWLLVRRALPRLAEILEARQDRIAADLDRAAEMRREAEEALAEYEKLLADAQAKAQARLAEVHTRLSAEAAERRAGLEAELHARQQAAEARIAEARTSALDEIDGVAAELAQAATERLIGVKVTKKQALAAVKGAEAA
jgi:F-type H+-transporting ATPase subunit b